MINHARELSIGKDRLPCPELVIRRYEKMVKGPGGCGELVTGDGEIIPALQRAPRSGKPVCVKVRTGSTVTSPATPLFYQSLKMK
jgi:acetolactate synthase-1/2/3 large subunit